MASLREMKRRRESVKNIQKITGAMKLVSTAKLKKARERLEAGRPYFNKMKETVMSIMERTDERQHPFFQGNGQKKTAVVLISGNRGLAGGYHSNIARAVSEAGLQPEHTIIYGAGRKGIACLMRAGYEIREDVSGLVETVSFTDVSALGGRLLKAYQKGEIGAVFLAYTCFKNSVSFVPMVTRLLPFSFSEHKENDYEAVLPMQFEPEGKEAVESIVPIYMSSMIYGALVESAACENAARMQAMDAAISNAEDMLETLTLDYNRARQSGITRELTEIISGAEALG